MYTLLRICLPWVAQATGLCRRATRPTEWQNTAMFAVAFERADVSVVPPGGPPAYQSGAGRPAGPADRPSGAGELPALPAC